MIEKLLYNFWLPRLLSRRCPPIISRSGEKGKAVNCFSLAVDKGGEPFLLLERYNGASLEAAEWDGTSYSNNRTTNLEEILQNEIRITHFYGLAEITFTSILNFTLHRLSGWEYIKVHTYWGRSKIGQFAFNYKRLLTKKRIDVIRILIDHHLESSHSGITSVGLMTRLYSIKWVNHPRSGHQHKKVRLYLDSLVSSGDVRKSGAEYVVTGAAISTLERFEEEERRHKQSVRLQRLIVALTVLIAVAALAQTKLVRLPELLDLSPSSKQTLSKQDRHHRTFPL